MTNPITIPPRMERLPVLVLAHGDGWIEVFAPEQVYAQIVHVPYVGTVAGELIAEQWLDVTLPRRMQEIYYPGNRRAADLARPLLPSDMVGRRQNIAILRTLEAIDSREPVDDPPPEQDVKVEPPEPPAAVTPGDSPAIRAANARAIAHKKRARRRGA